jgi:hypothetical protein
MSRIAAPVVGRVVLSRMRREQRRQESGKPYEPPTFYEVNPAEAARRRHATLCRWVSTTPPSSDMEPAPELT